jgi:hypothetical protein
MPRREPDQGRINKFDRSNMVAPPSTRRFAQKILVNLDLPGPSP